LVARAASRLLQAERYDCLLTTYIPLSSLRVADDLHQRFGIPWIADLRDIPDQFDPERRDRVVRRRAELLAGFCHSAAHWITVSPPLQEGSEERYSPRCPVSVIYNGCEETNARLRPSERVNQPDRSDEQPGRDWSVEVI